MNEEIRVELERVILESLKSVTHLDDEQRKDMVDDINKLYRLYLDDERLAIDDADSRDKIAAEQEQRKLDNIYRELQMKWERLDKKVRWGLEAAGIGLPLIFSFIWMGRGFKFEENGTYTSDTFRWLRQKFFRMK